MGSSVKVKYNTVMVLEELERKEQKFLEVAGKSVQSAAKGNLGMKGAIDTGNLQNSITYQVEDKKVTIGSPLEYAKFIEFGTGAANVPGGTSKPHWVYFNERDGQFHVAYPQIPRPWLKPALNKGHIRSLLLSTMMFD